MHISDNGFIDNRPWDTDTGLVTSMVRWAHSPEDKRLCLLGSLVHDGKTAMSVGPIGTVPRMNVTLSPASTFTTTVSIP